MKPSGGSVAGPRTLCFVSSSREKQVEFLGLAKTYLECNEPKLSIKCLSCAKEFQLSAQLCERLGKVRPSLRCRWENRAAPEPTPSAPACVREGPRASKEGHGSPEACRAVVLSTRPSVSTTPKMCARVHVCVKVCDPAGVSHRGAEGSNQRADGLWQSPAFLSSLSRPESACGDGPARHGGFPVFSVTALVANQSGGPLATGGYLIYNSS